MVHSKLVLAIKRGKLSSSFSSIIKLESEQLFDRELAGEAMSINGMEE